MTDVEAIEPDLDQVWVIDDPRAPPPPFAAAPPSCDRPEPQERGVLPHVERFAWRLEGDFSGLKAARDAIARSRRKVTIAHLDTGFRGAASCCRKISTASASDENPNNEPRSRHRGPPPEPGPRHGHPRHPRRRTRSRSATTRRPTSTAADFLSGAPRATIIPMPIANSVGAFLDSSVTAAIDAGRALKADVISMSMGGLRSAAWADRAQGATVRSGDAMCAGPCSRSASAGSADGFRPCEGGVLELSTVFGGSSSRSAAFSARNAPLSASSVTAALSVSPLAGSAQRFSPPALTPADQGFLVERIESL